MVKRSDCACPSEGKEKIKTKSLNLSGIAFSFFGKGEAGEAHLVWWLITRVGRGVAPAVAPADRSWVWFASEWVRSPLLGDSPGICSL